MLSLFDRYFVLKVLITSFLVVGFYYVIGIYVVSLYAISIEYSLTVTQKSEIFCIVN